MDLARPQLAMDKDFLKMKNTPLKAVIFDLDGVITQTALVHSRAWKEMFDQYLRERAEKYGESFREFTHEGDYLTYVDGKPRYEGVKSFLASRGIELPFGDPDDGPEKESICGIGNRKNIAFNLILERDGVQVYPSTVKLMAALRERGTRIGVASSSKNCEKVLEAAGLLDWIETRVDGVVSAELGLQGKPEADIFTTAAANLGVECHNAVVVEDAISGVQAGRKGNFGLVLGLAREDNARALLANGADIVVQDIAEIGLEGILKWFAEGMDKDAWQLVYHDYDPAKERSREALLSVANGYFGTRGSMEENGINAVNYPATYMAGVYNRTVSRVSGRDVENEDFVNGIHWLPILFRIGQEEWLDVNRTNILQIRRSLDLRQGVLHRTMVVEDKKGRQTRIRSRRFASMQNPHLAGIEYSLTPLNYSDQIEIKAMLRGDHINKGVKRYAELDQHHIKATDAWVSGNIQFLEVQTTQSGIKMSATSRLDVSLEGQMHFPDYEAETAEGLCALSFAVLLGQGASVTLQKSVFLNNELQKEVFENQPLDRLNNAGSWEEMLQDSAAAWEKIWEETDIRIDGDRQAQRLLRLHIYHLIGTTSPHNAQIDFGIPARGLTGEAYRGHIFWDELYILPFYFLHFPAIARSVLMYRYRRMEEARKYAQAHGYQGLMFPWQSGSSGREETQQFHFNPLSGKWGDDHSARQRHVNLAIAWNILTYHHITGDQEFMLRQGAEMLTGICRLFFSMAKKDPDSGHYSIPGVMGPDEFHEHLPGSEEGGLQDNAYTNVMTAWMMQEVLAWFRALPPAKVAPLQDLLGLKEAEMQEWEKLSQGIRLVMHDGILAQFEGYFELQELDWEDYRRRYGNIYRMDRILKAEGKSPDAYKLAKQADALMLFYVLPETEVRSIIEGAGYALPGDFVSRNFDYYLPRTSHGSTLSRVVHALLAHRLDRKALAWDLYREALGSDLNDIQGGTTAEGIHSGVMAGTVMIALNAYAGLDLSGSNLSLAPDLPLHWKEMVFRLRFRGSSYRFRLHHDITEIEVDQEVEILYRGNSIRLEAGVNRVQ